jgi:hypothetical chaperone protein
MTIPSRRHTSGTTLGLDFGTTNTVAARTDAAGKPDVLTFALGGEQHTTFRSVLCFFQSRLRPGVSENRIEAGPWGIARFAEDPQDCRFLQSFKTFAASRAFADTIVQGKRYRFEDLLATFLKKMESHAGEQLKPRPKRLVIGRPVTFAGGDPDEALAIQRYQGGLAELGFDSVDFVYEPVAAAFFYAQRLTRSATILVADFGGGPSRRQAHRPAARRVGRRHRRRHLRLPAHRPRRLAAIGQGHALPLVWQGTRNSSALFCEFRALEPACDHEVASDLARA